MNIFRLVALIAPAMRGANATGRYRALPLVMALTMSSGALAAACNWTGGSGDWHDAAKWSCGAVPTAADDVTITNLGFGNTLTVNAAAPAKSLTFNSSGTVSGNGAFDVTGTTSITTQFSGSFSTVGSHLPVLEASVALGTVLTLTDPALTADSFLSVSVSRPPGSNGSMVFDVGVHNVGTLNLQNAQISLNAPLTVTTALSWNQSAISSITKQPLILAPGSVSTLTGGGNSLATALVTSGTLTWSGIGPLSVGAVSWTNHGTLNLQAASSTADTTFDSGLQFGGSSMAFTNYGTINASHTGTVRFETAGFDNHGTVMINSGTLWTAWSPYKQYAGLLRLNGGRIAGATKCCSLDATQIYLYGGELSGGGNGLYDVVGGIENDGGTVRLDSALRVSNFYTQTARGSLAVTINGTTPGTDFGTMNVVKRAGLNSNGSVSLAGGLIVDRGAAFSPRAGDRFAIVTAEGNVSGNTSGGSGSMYPAFAAFAGLGQITIAEPAAALLLQAKADAASSLRNDVNGYTVQMVNPTTAAISVFSMQVTIPIDFTYQDGSSTGIATTNPFVSDNTATGSRTLTWNFASAVAIAPGGLRALHFGVTVGASTKIGRYRISGSVSGTSAASFTHVAPIDVKAASALSSTTISISGGGGTTIQNQNGTRNIMLKRSDIATTVISLRTRISCPPEMEPCGNLRTVYLGQEFNGRYYNITQLTLDPNQNEPVISARRADSVTMRAPAQTPPSMTKAGTDYGFWKGQIPGAGSIPGVPQKIYPDWDAHRPCIAFNGDGNGLFPTNCVGGGGGGGGGGDDLGTPQLYDPSGIITDATTGLPIGGATVSLYRQIPGLPDTPTLTRNCRTIDTRGGLLWTGSAPDTGVFEQPGFAPAQISPDVNPQVTGVDGRYGWNVVTGCWYVKVSAPGYASRISALVGVPPEVTDLDLALQPVVAGPVALILVVSRKTHASAGTFELPINHTVAIGDNVTVEPRAVGSGHSLVFRFDGPVVTVGGVSARDAVANPIGAVSETHSGNEIVVNLTGVADNRRVKISLAGINGLVDVSASIGFLVGDVNSSQSVDAGDRSGMKARTGHTAIDANFMFDLNTSGSITAADIAAVKARAGQRLN